MKEKSIVMVGTKSPLDSAFAVFEHFIDWTSLRANKILPDRAYFVVVVLAEENKADIAPNLFVQGYRPHSSGKQVLVDRRRYDAFVPHNCKTHQRGDVVFVQSQLYQIKGEREVELILTNGQSQQREAVKALANRICRERSYQKLSDIREYRYCCHSSAGYFLANRNYHVWSAMIGEDVGGQLVKKMLVLDYFTGIPAVVAYHDKLFEAVSL